MAGVLIRREDTETQREKGNGKIEAEVVKVFLQAKEGPGLPATIRS